MSNNLISNQSVLAFDGIDDNLTLPKGFPTIDRAITIEFWAKGENSLKHTTNIFNACNAQGNRLANVHLPWAGQIFWDAGDENGSSDRINKGVKLKEYNVWTHWAFVKDVATGKMLIYRNGEIWHQGEGQKKSLAGIEKFIIGCYSDYSLYWKGSLTEFRIWNVARTPEEIQQNMNSRLTGKEPGLVGYYPLNGDSNDQTSNANNGIINGAIWKQEELPIQTQASKYVLTAANLLTDSKIKLKSWKGDYLHRPDTAQDVTTWSTGVGNEWTVEALGDNKIQLKSWKGDYLHRPDTAQGVTTWSTGVGNEWTVEALGDNKIQLKSWKGDYLHRPDTAQGVTTWSTGVGNEWELELISITNVDPVNFPEQANVLSFDGIDDRLELPKGFPAIDKAITIEFWAKGENSLTQQTTILGATNAQNARVLNVHLPWKHTENTRIFWDAGNDSGFDRIDKEVKLEEYNPWTHWAFVKDVATEQMFIYRQGEIWHKGDGNKRSLAEINKFTIGSFVNSSNFWKGSLTEFRIWNIARTPEEIKQKMNSRLTGKEPGLVGYYPLNGDANDRTSNSNNGIINGAIWKQEELPIKAAISVDKKISVLFFDGIDDYIKLPDGILTASYTKEAWIKLTEPAKPESNILSGNQHALYVPNAIASGHNQQWFMVYTPQPCPKNTWLHVAVTYDSQTQIMCLYQDGQLASQASHVPPFEPSDRTLNIGIYRNGYFFKGEIAEARVWNFARTQQMIQETMSSRLTGQETGLAAYYPLNEGSGNVATDKTGKGNNGTINGATWKQEELPIQATISGEIEVATQPPVSNFAKVGPKGGSIPAIDFELLPKDTAQKSRLKTVFVNANWPICALQVEYENIASTPGETYRSALVGNSAGIGGEFTLQPGDYLTKISGTWGSQATGYIKEEIITLQFETKQGVKSPVFGGKSGTQEIVEAFVFEAPEGQEIIGFFGSHGGPQNFLVRLGIYCQPISIPENQQTSEPVQPSESLVIPENQQTSEPVQPPESLVIPENQQPSEPVQPPESLVIPENQQPSEPVQPPESLAVPENRQPSKSVLKLRKGFSFDEAILMTTLSKYAYDVFQYDDGSVDDVELKTVYKALYKNQGWELVHCIRNDTTNIRGLILKNTQSAVAHQYAVSLRGTSVNDKDTVNLDNIASDVDWKLIDYGSLAVQKAKVVQGLHLPFESVADEIQCFFKTLRGELKPSDFRRLNQLNPLRKFACITALANAGAIRLGSEFEQQAQDLVAKVIADGEIDNDKELEKILQFVEEQLLSKLSPLTEPIEVWVTGYSLGAALCQLAGLSLRRWFGSASSGGLLIKVYAIASPKIGNQQFVDYYNKQIGADLSYRIENVLDIVPTYPYDPPFPIGAIAPEGLLLGNVYIGKYANGGEAITVMGLGSGQSASISFGGLFSIPFSVPFPHSPETYIELLQEQKQFWYQLVRPAKDILRPFLIELLRDEHKTDISPERKISDLNRHENISSVNSDEDITIIK